MRNLTITKPLSVFLSLALLVSSFPGTAVSAAPVSTPAFVKALTPNSNLGYVDSFYKGNTEKPVILIQDLHANYGVQKKILGLLEFLKPQVAPAGRPMVIGIEGAWGDVDLTPVRNEKEDMRRKASDILLKGSEISAMSYFAVMSKENVRLVGIDNPEDYIIHTELFQKSLAARLALAKKTDQLRQAIQDSKADAPRSLRRIWKTEEAFNAGEIGLPELSKKLGVSLANYKDAEVALAKKKADLVKEEEGQKAFFLKNVVEADQNLNLLGRLLRQHLTYEEVQYASKRIPSMLATVRALLPGENLALWSDTIRAAIDHYAVAMVRDQPMSERTLSLVEENPNTSVVIVTGGFHTAGIVQALKQKRTSYVVIAPIVESHTARDEEVYLQRMMDIHMTDAEIVSAARSVRPGAQTLGLRDANVAHDPNNSRSPWFQGSFSVVPRVLAHIRGGLQPAAAATAQVAPQVAALNRLVVETPDVKSPGPLARIKASVQRRLGQSPEIAVTTTNAPDAASMTLSQAAPQPAASVSRGPGKGKVITGLAVGAILTNVNVAYAQAGGALEKVANSGTDSTTLAVAAVGAVAAGAIAYFGGTKKGRETAKQAIARTRIRMSA